MDVTIRLSDFTTRWVSGGGFEDGNEAMVKWRRQTLYFVDVARFLAGVFSDSGR